MAGEADDGRQQKARGIAPELERAWDWISSDPDFRIMRDQPATFTVSGHFLAELKHSRNVLTPTPARAKSRTRIHPGFSLPPRGGRHT